MAEKRRFLDVWIIESNTVYQEVPYSVVLDWVQQGRLLADDMLRWSGQKDWFQLGGNQAFAAYLPRPEPTRSEEDRAEALAPVDLGFRWRRRPEDEDEDVDMIPLIDVSLVLLIFFVMTASTGVAAYILLPHAQNFILSEDPQIFWVGIDRTQNERGDAAYSYLLGAGEGGALKTYPTQSELVAALRERLAASQRARVDINVKAHEDMPAGMVRELLVALQMDEKINAKLNKKYIGVR